MTGFIYVPLRWHRGGADTEYESAQKNAGEENSPAASASVEGAYSSHCVCLSFHLCICQCVQYCLSDIFWTTQMFLTKLGVVVYYEMESHAEKLVGYLPDKVTARAYIIGIWLFLLRKVIRQTLSIYVESCDSSFKYEATDLFVVFCILMLYCRHSVGTYQETSSHATHQGTLDHCHLSSLSHFGLILA